MKILIIIFIFLLLNAGTAFAHCPLCTIGAAAAAGGAAYLGVSNIVIGLFVGAFAVSTGYWIARMIKRKYMPYQTQVLVLFSFITTIYPLNKLLAQMHPLFLPWLGDYGTTYAINIFLVGSIVGGIIVSIAPFLSKKLGNMRNGKMIPYQGIILTLGLLIVTGIILQGML